MTNINRHLHSHYQKNIYNILLITISEMLKFLKIFWENMLINMFNKFDRFMRFSEMVETEEFLHKSS